MSRIAVCYSGQLRTARFVANSHVERMFKPLAARGFQVDVFVCTERSNTARAREPSDNSLVWRRTELAHSIDDWTALISPWVSSIQVRVIENSDQLAQADCAGNFYAQFEKFHAVLEMASKAQRPYEFVIRVRPDVFFEGDVQLPESDTDVVGNMEELQQYLGDVFQCFFGPRLADVVASCMNVSVDNITAFSSYESVVIHVFESLGMRIRYVPRMVARWAALQCHYFRHMDWRFFDDFQQLEYAYPFDIDILRKIRRQIVPSMYHRSVKFDSDTDSSEPDAIIFNDIVPTNTPRLYQAMFLSALEPNRVTIPAPDHPLREFIVSELLPYARHSIGLMPCAGTASRLSGIPKFLLPSPDRHRPLIGTLASRLFDAELTCVSGVSDENYASVVSADNYIHRVRVGRTKTMSETVANVLAHDRGIVGSKVVMAMPDTYYHAYDREIARLVDILDRVSIAVIVWPIREDQFGKLGQCDVVDGRVVAHRDKDPTCRFPYAWGVMGWQRTASNLIDPSTPHVGYMISAAISAGVSVGAVVARGEYFDCGTFDEYFRLIKLHC